MSNHKMLEDYPEHMTVTQMMEVLNVSQNKAYQMLIAGEVDFFSIGSRNKRVFKKSLVEYIEKNTHKKQG